MKRFYYESPIAKLVLGLSSCHTITLGPFVFSKRKENDIPQNIRNHETCHSFQWIEIACLVGLLVFVLQLTIGIAAWWYLTSAIAFYLWYGIEYMVRLCLYLDTNKAYKMVSFEQEAYTSEHDANYIENRHMFTGWLNTCRFLKHLQKLTARRIDGPFSASFKVQYVNRNLQVDWIIPMQKYKKFLN